MNNLEGITETQPVHSSHSYSAHPQKAGTSLDEGGSLSLKIQRPRSILISASSFSGKSILLQKLLKDTQKFFAPDLNISKVVVITEKGNRYTLRKKCVILAGRWE